MDRQLRAEKGESSGETWGKLSPGAFPLCAGARYGYPDTGTPRHRSERLFEPVPTSVGSGRSRGKGKLSWWKGGNGAAGENAGEGGNAGEGESAGEGEGEIT